jgi:uncharacterized protein
MDTQDRKAIDELFAKLAEVERSGGARDAEAEGLIREKIASQPGSPYYMAQAIVFQEQALRTAQEQIADLERQLAERPAGGGFLSGLFGGGQPQTPTRPQDRSAVPSGLGQPMAGMTAGRGGGFLAGAAQTAAGVAGGVLLGNAIAGMFGGDEAKAATPQQTAQTPPAEEPQAEPASDEGGGFFDSVFGDDGGEEI